MRRQLRVNAAQKLKRKWTGIDITHLADREAAEGSLQEPGEFDVFGTPGDLDAARGVDDGAHEIVVSVKSGKVKADDVCALNHVHERETAEIALLIWLDEPSKGMLADAASAGLYNHR